jgi:exo-1,4-beta-D-glucosaminidase
MTTGKTRPRLLVLFGAVIALTCATVGPSTNAIAGPSARHGAAPSANLRVTSASRADTQQPQPQYAVPGTPLGAGGWQVLSTAKTSATAAAISSPGFSTSGWLPVTNDDGGAPGTEIEALLQNGACPNVYYSTNMKTCFGYESAIGADTVAQFDVPWWYRTDFTSDLASGQYANLVVNGIVGAANVWVNGHEVATQSTVEGAYTRYTFDVTGDLVHGTNTLALEIEPNNPNTMLTLDDVDWNQIPPDNNTGIQMPIQLLTSDALSDADAHVVENNAANLSSSALTVKTNVTNHTSSAQTGVVAHRSR